MKWTHDTWACLPLITSAYYMADSEPATQPFHLMPKKKNLFAEKCGHLCKAHVWFEWSKCKVDRTSSDSIV